MSPRSQKLIGRDRELEVLEQALAEAAEPGTRVMLLRGEAGIGKSALLEAFLARATERGTKVLAGRAQLAERGIPYAALHHAIARLEPGASAEEQALLDRLSRALRAPTSRGGPVDERLATALDAALDLVAHLATEGSVVVAVDDLHVGDEETLALLGALARRSVATPVLLVATLRTDLSQASPAVDQFLAEVELDCRASALELTPLSRDSVAEVLESLSGQQPTDELTDQVYERSRGNAFFVAELGAAGVSEPVRPSRRTALIERLLPPDAAALSMAKVLSAVGALPLSQLPAAGEVARLSAEESQAAFDGLVRARLLVPTGSGGYAFRHEILREAVYDELGPAERLRIHSELAEQLSRLREAGRDVDPVTIAHHAMAAADGPDEGAAARVQAAADSLRSFAPRSAATWYEHSLRLTPAQSASRATRLARHGHALINAGLFSEGIAQGRDALAGHLDPDERVRCVATVAEALMRRGEAAALDLIEHEIQRGVMHPRLLISRMLALTTLGRFEEAEQASQQARAGTADSPKDHALAVLYSAVLAGAQGNGARLESLVEQTWQLSAGLPRHVQQFVFGFAASLLAQEARVDRAEQLLGQLQELRGDDSPGEDERADMALALIAFYRGDWDAALSRVSRLSHLQDESRTPGPPYLQHVEATIRASRGDVAGARQVTLAPASGVPPYLRVEQHATRAWIDLLDRRPAAARQECDSCEAALSPLTGTTRVFLAILRAQACHMLGDARAAQEYLELFRPAEDGELGPRLQLEALLARAEVTGDVTPARLAHEVAESRGLVFYAAQAQLLRGQLDDDPATTLTEAWRAFRALGAEVWRGRAAGALRARRLPVPRARRTSAEDELTDLEREIVMLVYEGLSNEKIAERLSYSRHSITAYLGRIYSKTGCASRLDLVRAVTEGVLG